MILYANGNISIQGRDVSGELDMRRNRLDIIINILEVAREGINKTGIVYRTNLNFRLADKYLALLIEKGFMEKIGEEYATTDSGKAFLGKAREISSQLFSGRGLRKSNNTEQHASNSRNL